MNNIIKREPEEEAAFPAAKRSKTGASAVVASLLGDQKYSDLQVHCRDKVFQVHRNIICPRSRFFDACVNGQFKEAQERIIKLPDDEPQIVELLVAFLYTNDYDYRKTQSATNRRRLQSPDFIDLVNYDPKNSELTVHAKVYVIADKFGVQDLKELAREKFKDELLEDQVDTFAYVVEWVLENTPESDKGLRPLCIEFGAKHLEDLIARGDFYKFCERDGKFTAALLREVAHARCDRLDGKVLEFLEKRHELGFYDGTHVSIIASRLGAKRRDVFIAADKLEEKGLVSTMVDDETWGV